MDSPASHMNAQGDPAPALDRPSILIVRVLEACDANCFMCAFRRSADGYRFPPDEAAALAEAAAAAGVRLVRLTGGEPLLHAELAEVIAAFRSHGLAVSVITNGSRLAALAPALIAAGLGQAVVSLDGLERTHDRARGTPGLFRAAAAGIARLRQVAPSCALRVNTVVGPHNMAELGDLYDRLAAWGVDDWSIIPLKRARRAWEHGNPEGARAAFRSFQARVDSRPGPRLLGASREWMGRDAAEVEAFLDSQRSLTPRGRCRVPELVRYYTPKDGRLYDCNCVPHRLAERDLGRAWRPGQGPLAAESEPGAWLKRHGPARCTGCEPVNAALGEGGTAFQGAAPLF